MVICLVGSHAHDLGERSGCKHPRREAVHSNSFFTQLHGGATRQVNRTCLRG